MDVPASGKPAPVVIEVAAYLVARGWGLCGWGQERGGGCHVGGRDPAHIGETGVLGAGRSGVVLAQAVLAPWDGLRPSREGLIVQPDIRGGPV